MYCGLQVFKNLKLFMENKNPEDDLFDRISVSMCFTFGIIHLIFVSVHSNRELHYVKYIIVMSTLCRQSTSIKS